MDALDLAALKAGDEDAWERAFAALWPVVFAAAHARLAATYPGEVEEVAIESLEALTQKVRKAKSATDLHWLAKTIAERHAISRWRELTAGKRGEGKVQSLDAPLNGGDPAPEPASPAPDLSALDLDDLSRLLAVLAEGLKPDHKTALHDFFLDGLSYKEISLKRGWASGSIGVYIQRGLAAMREQRVNRMHLLKEAATFLRLLLW
jgi:DNA-directed RNA polymerase specialized sigma24 family protein